MTRAPAHPGRRTPTLACRTPASLTVQEIAPAVRTTHEFVASITGDEPGLHQWWLDMLTPPVGHNPDGLTSDLLARTSISGVFADGSFHTNRECTYLLGVTPKDERLTFAAASLPHVISRWCENASTQNLNVSGTKYRGQSSPRESLQYIDRILRGIRTVEKMQELPVLLPDALAVATLDVADARRALSRTADKSWPTQLREDTEFCSEAAARLDAAERTLQKARQQMVAAGWLNELYLRHTINQGRKTLIRQLNRKCEPSKFKGTKKIRHAMVNALLTTAASGPMHWALDEVHNVVQHPCTETFTDIVRDALPVPNISTEVDDSWDIIRIKDISSFVARQGRTVASTAAHTVALLDQQVRSSKKPASWLYVPRALRKTLDVNKSTLVGTAQPGDDRTLLEVCDQLWSDGTVDPQVVPAARNALR